VIALATSSSLSARSRISCSAFFRPTRGTLCGEGREHPEGERRADPFRAEHLLEDPALVGGGEAVELPAVLLHDQVREDGDGLAGPGERLVRAERHEELVADAAGSHHLDPVELLREQLPREL
jgi:hypothetical protein